MPRPSTRRTTLERLWLKAGKICHWCGVLTRLRAAVNDDLRATKDHVMPLSKGGTNERSNIVLSCWRCNRTKGDKHPAQWSPPTPPSKAMQRAYLAGQMLSSRQPKVEQSE